MYVVITKVVTNKHHGEHCDLGSYDNVSFAEQMQCKQFTPVNVNAFSQQLIDIVYVKVLGVMMLELILTQKVPPKFHTVC